LSHPLAKPIVPHLPDPVKSLVNANGEWEWGSWVEKGGVGEFESARVYLARWARIVAEEGELARRREAQAIPSSSGNAEEETSSLGIFELLQSTSNLPTPKSSRDPRHPVNEKMWAEWFDGIGRPKVDIEVMKREVFRRGVDPYGTLRRKIWPFILGVHDWDATDEQRAQRWEGKRYITCLPIVSLYSHEGLGDGIMNFGTSGVEFRKYLTVQTFWTYVIFCMTRVSKLKLTANQERHRIDVDCRRTDRNQPLFASEPSEGTDEKEAQMHYSIISPQMNDIGAQSPTNEHTERLAGILLTYNFYEKELG
jgi:hypothetical protein